MRKRWIAALLALGLIGFGMLASGATLPPIASPVAIDAFGNQALQDYLLASEDGAPWTLLAAIDAVEWERLDLGDVARISLLNRWLTGKTVAERLASYGGSPTFDQKVRSAMSRLYLVEDMLDPARVFPLPKDSGYSYEDGWGAPRTYGGARPHLGIDIIVDKNTPIASIGAGLVTRKGWDEKGGWRVGITDRNGIYHYYAHMSAYEPGVEVGDWVQPGQVIGYVGSSGYGPVGTDDVMIPHLHVGLYEADVAVNPYPFLLFWDAQS